MMEHFFVFSLTEKMRYNVESRINDIIILDG